MNNNMLLSAAVSVVPLLAIVFVCALLLQKLYIRIRARFGVTVNCWFCNQNTKVPYLEANSWTCPHCEQYNGFTKDGDYNREIFQQLDCSNLSSDSRTTNPNESAELFTQLPPHNGFCNVCNEAQRLKIEKLAQFEPKNESHFDEELKVYKTQLEEQYRLCTTCDRHLRKVLREKKKMVLGSKFLDFIIKGAETLQQPHFNHLRHMQQLQWKRRVSHLITVLIVMNICCLISVLPTLKRDHCTRYLGENVGQFAFVCLSHVMAFGRVIYTYIDSLGQHETIEKIILFVRTIFMMLLYSMGLKLPQLIRYNFVSLYLFSCPFAVLVLAFIYNIIDSFRLTHFTVLLVVWSTLAGGFIGEHMWVSQNTLLLAASIVTITLLLMRKEVSSLKLHDTTASSFHKIYSEDYLSDEDTISLLSQQLNTSSASMCSMNTNNRSFSKRVISPRSQMHQTQSVFSNSPLTSSVLSFDTHQQPLTRQKQFSPNTSFQSFRIDGNNQPLRSNYAASMCNFPTIGRAMSPPHPTSLFASNLELSYRERPMSTRFGMSAFPTDSTNCYNTTNNFIESRTTFDHNSAEHLPFVAAGTSAAVNRAGAIRNGQGMSVMTTPLHSPFSLSSNAVFQQQPQQQHQPLHYDINRSTPATNLLSPSRFSTTSLAGGLQSVGTSWLSGGYFNANAQPQRLQRNAHMTAIEENLSRASSQSSGFESQTGRLFGTIGGSVSACGIGSSINGGINQSRENSYGPPTETIEANMVALDGGNNKSAFRPVERPRSSAFDSWNPPPARKALHGSDSFNLRRINEELPSIKRGDLLKKWKESQTHTAATAS